MRVDKNKAIKLRKTGLSYLQISQMLNIPKSTLSAWLKDIMLSKTAQDKIDKRVYIKSITALIKRNKAQTTLAAERALKIKKSAIVEAKQLITDKLFLVGTALYWAEGYKKGAQGSKWKSVDFANSDPEMIKLMMKYFRKFCQISENKFTFQLIAHENINIEDSVTFWSKIVKCPTNQFIKTTISNKTGRIPKHGKSLTNGTIHIRINDVTLFFRVIGWIDFLKKKFI